MLEEIRKERLRKKIELEKLGYNVYPTFIKRTHLIGEVLKNFEELAKKSRRPKGVGIPAGASGKIFLAGRVIGWRVQGGVAFADLKDESGKLQAVLLKSNLPDFDVLKNSLDIGDFLEVGGSLFKTKAGEKSIEAKSARIIVKSLLPLPSVWHGLKEIEERYRKRYLDLLLNPEVREKVMARAKIIEYLRSGLVKEGFTEVETPVLQPIPGGAKARPFITHHNALDADFYLRIAPELYLKRLLVGGLERVFEIGRNFRNEGVDRDHNPEFTMLEMYWAYQDYRGLMKFTEKLLKKFIPGKWQTITFAELYKKHTGRDWRKEDPKKLDDVYKHEIRIAGKVEKTTFVTDYPAALMPLAKLKTDNSELTESFQLIPGSKSGLGPVAEHGAEVVKGFSELNDPVFQRKQMEEQEKAFRAGNEEFSRVDEEFIEALEYGMPPAAGMGIGVDRLAALVTKSRSLKEVIIFPTLRPKE